MNYLKLLHLQLCHCGTRADGGSIRVPGSKLGESGSTRRVNGTVAYHQPAMLLTSSRPHDHLGIERVGSRIPVWTIELLSHLRISSDTGVKGGVAVV